MKTKLSILLSALFLLSACAGPNPNIGERTTDMAWYYGNYEKAFSVVKPRADAGQPWAQLRLAIFYENGWGVEEDNTKAFELYQKASTQKAEGMWADGIMIGAVGKTGYFNQNSDARIAEYNLARLYYYGKGTKKDLIKAYIHVNNVIKESEGQNIFFCCGFAESRYFTQEQFSDLKTKIQSEMTSEQINKAEKIINAKDS